MLVPWQPVVGGAPDAARAADFFTPAQLDRAESFSWWTRVWSWGALALHLLALSLVGFTRRGRQLVLRLPGSWWQQVIFSVVCIEVGLRVLVLPLNAASRQHRLNHGLSTQTWADWSRDLAVSAVISILMTTFAVLILLLAMRRWSQRWPAVAGLGAASLVLLGSWLYPIVVEPLFNSLEPLPDGTLRSAILDMAEREGVQLDDVWVADASRRTTSLNAYVSGLDLPGAASTRRVVLYDTLLDEATHEQVLTVVAHEISHARHQDVLTGTALGALGVLVAVGALPWLLPRRHRASATQAPILVPLVLALVAWGVVLAAPIENGVSRRLELRADLDALKATGDPVAFREMQVKLALLSLADPSPPAISQWWWGSHPTVLDRVALTQSGPVEEASWDAEQAGGGGAEESHTADDDNRDHGDH